MNAEGEACEQCTSAGWTRREVEIKEAAEETAPMDVDDPPSAQSTQTKQDAASEAEVDETRTVIGHDGNTYGYRGLLASPTVPPIAHPRSSFPLQTIIAEALSSHHVIGRPCVIAECDPVNVMLGEQNACTPCIDSIHRAAGPNMAHLCEQPSPTAQTEPQAKKKKWPTPSWIDHPQPALAVIEVLASYRGLHVEESLNFPPYLSNMNIESLALKAEIVKFLVPDEVRTLRCAGPRWKGLLLTEEDISEEIWKQKQVEDEIAYYEKHDISPFRNPHRDGYWSE